MKKESFMDAVSDYQKKNHCTVTEALMAVAEAKPKLHETFLNKSKGQNHAQQHQKDENERLKKVFLEAVGDHQKENSCSRTEALKSVAQRWPRLHAAFRKK